MTRRFLIAASSVVSCLLLLLVSGMGCGPDVEQAIEKHDHLSHTAEGLADHPDDRACEQGETTDHAHHHDSEDDDESDLDLAVEELLAAECEHDMRAHQCDECRYEVGVARVDRGLIDEGLVQVASVAAHVLSSEIELTGEIRFDERKIANLGPRLPGIVRRVHVDLGQSVAAGQPLLDIDSAELADAQGEYLTALAEQKLAVRNHERQRGLREAKITSEREYMEAEQEADAGSIRANAGRQKLLRLGMTAGEIAALESAGLAGAAGQLVLKAPFDGEVLGLHAVRGEQVEPSSELVLFGDTRELWVWVDLYEAHLAAVTRAIKEDSLPAVVSVRAYPMDTFRGYVDFIGREMDESTRTIKARITLANPEGKLRPGMFANVHLATGGNGGGLAVPPSAVLSDEGRDFVFVHQEDDYFMRRPVRMGRESEEFVEILDGLELGQTIVVAGGFLLKSDVLRSKMGEGCAH